MEIVLIVFLNLYFFPLGWSYCLSLLAITSTVCIDHFSFMYMYEVLHSTVLFKCKKQT